MKFSSPLEFPISLVPNGFGAALRDARHALGWTQARLAAAAGIKRETVARLERDRRRPSADTVFRLQDALDVMPGELVPAWPEWSPIGLSTMGARSRERRRQLGLSLKAVAAASGVSSATLSRFERDMKWNTVSLLDAGAGAPPTVAAEALAKALGFSNAEAHETWCELNR